MRNSTSRITWAAAGVAALLAVLFNFPSVVRADEYAIGADISFLAHAEARGMVFKDDGQAKPGLQIFKDHGYNWIRLRLFHSPDAAAEQSRLHDRAGASSQEAAASSSCSTTTTPTLGPIRESSSSRKAWEGMSHEELAEAVFEYTRDTIAAFREAGAMPDMVQIGNEVIGGMLWPDGRLAAELGPISPTC